MTYSDMGTTGAKRQSWRKANPRDILRRIIASTPEATREALFDAFSQEVFTPENQPVLESIVEYWFANNLISLMPRKQQSGRAGRGLSPATVQMAAEARQRVTESIQIAAQTIFLDLMLPHGKSLRESTGAECSALGGWLAVIGTKVLPDAIVGKVLSEEQVRALFDAQNGS